MLFNRAPTNFGIVTATTTALAARLAGATLTLLNYYGDVVGNVILTNGMIQVRARVAALG